MVVVVLWDTALTMKHTADRAFGVAEDEVIT
jgi:hypothetical protein